MCSEEPESDSFQFWGFFWLVDCLKDLVFIDSTLMIPRGNYARLIVWTDCPPNTKLNSFKITHITIKMFQNELLCPAPLFCFFFPFKISVFTPDGTVALILSEHGSLNLKIYSESN